MNHTKYIYCLIDEKTRKRTGSNIKDFKPRFKIVPFSSNLRVSGQNSFQARDDEKKGKEKVRKGRLWNLRDHSESAM